VKERPILFSGPMVRAILAWTKTQTRRVVRGDFTLVDDWPHRLIGGDGHEVALACPYGVPGDRLWVRETWRSDDFAPDDPSRTIYRADGPDDLIRETRGIIRWRPSIFLPRYRSRLTLEVTAVRVERLQDISEEDAEAEGAFALGDAACSHREWFMGGWDSINGKRAPWASNPWVWVVTFRRLAPSPDRIEPREVER
jgi:hypothetical protein